jgi:radical SAM superfamily enzyme YgiQ (UPF0313 family)
MQPSAQDQARKSFLLLTPFPYNDGERYNINVDAVISRHSGARTKSGVFFPTGLAYISALLKQHGFPVQLLDVVPQDVSLQAVLRATEETDFIVMPVSSTRWEDTIAFLKAHDHRVRIGISNFASLYAEKLLREGICDIVLHGEVEFTCLKIAQAFGRSPKPDLSEIEGLSFLDDGEIVRTPPASLTKDLDQIPFPDREGMDHSVYTDAAFLGAPTAYILTARGCPFRCTFCSTHLTYNYRAYYRSPENVVAEVQEVVQKYGVHNIYFIDDTFTLHPTRVNKICDLITEQKLDIRWACLGRIDVINDVMLEKMKAAGCIEIRFGIESGNDQILKNIKKDLTVAKVEKGIRLMEKHGMRYTLFFMLGNPGEDRATVRETIRFARKLNALFASFNIATPLPGSALFDSHRESFEFDDISSFNTVSSDFSVCELSPRTLRRYLIYAYFSYYIRPAFFMKLFSELRSRPRETWTTLKFLAQQARAVIG